MLNPIIAKSYLGNFKETYGKVQLLPCLRDLYDLSQMSERAYALLFGKTLTTIADIQAYSLERVNNAIFDNEDDYGGDAHGRDETGYSPGYLLQHLLKYWQTFAEQDLLDICTVTPQHIPPRLRAVSDNPKELFLNLDGNLDDFVHNADFQLLVFNYLHYTLQGSVAISPNNPYLPDDLYGMHHRLIARFEHVIIPSFETVAAEIAAQHYAELDKIVAAMAQQLDPYDDDSIQYILSALQQKWPQEN
jgi:hypothetical protein